MKVPARCKNITTQKLIRISESGRSFTLKNTSGRSISLVSVDGCAITDGERCDYLYLSDREKELYVELKGSDIKKAVNQISRSILMLSQLKTKAGRTAVIVSSRVPAEDTGTMTAKFYLTKNMVTTLKIKNGSLEIDADSVI